MRVYLIALALFAIVKGPEYYTNYIAKKQREVKHTISYFYKNDPLEAVGIKFPNVVKAQIALETQWLTSKIYKKNNNMFGMKASCRNWDCGNQFGHALYKSREHSLMDYRDWQAMRFEQARKRGVHIPTTDEEYIYFLQHLPGGGSYAEDPKYPEKLRYIINL